ncbi:MAG: sugar phosphate isomerase/epimerase [Clostridia bacterium]|nr:sugar phosphate isomerase/epimerase [Clostridia bacterium]
MTEYGIQMYSLRDITEDDLRGSLKRAADMGYKYIEFAGFFGNSAEDVRAWLDEYGLVPIGTHTGIDQLTEDNIESTIAYHKALGCTNIIIPAADWSSEEKMERNLSVIRTASARLAKEGIALGYHNHSSEFYKTPYGRYVEEEIIEKTDAFLEIDTFWVFNVGISPVRYLEAHKDRIKLIHLKDGYIERLRALEFSCAHDGAVGTSVGEGEVPILAIREWAVNNGVPMVIESEGLDPTGPDEVKRCIDFLRTLDA